MAPFLSFLIFATAIAVAPGPDTFLTLRNTVTRGHENGLWTMAGICAAGATQGILAAAGLGALIANAQPVFEVIRWAGIAYLVYLGVSSLRAAFRSAGTPWGDADASSPPVSAGRCFRQGFLCNITNPKVLAFNLAVLPQFVGDDGGLGLLLMYALTLTGVGAVVLLCVVLAAAHARALLQRPAVSRAVEGGTGVVMLGFAGALALERH